MLTIRHPKIIPYIHEFALGLIPIGKISHDGYPILVVKASKEAILASRLNKGFKIYVAQIKIDTYSVVGLISAFFDNQDEPLVIHTPLFKDELTSVIINLILSQTIDIYLFDENNREFLGYTSTIEINPKNKKNLQGLKLVPFNISYTKEILDQMYMWFSRRTIEDDDSSITVSFSQSLFPEDIFIIDATPQNNSYQGAGACNFTSLIRENPGRFQEIDIVLLLQRIFLPEQIHINPLRISNNKEIVDVLVVTESNILLIEAKDSPNTDQILNATVTRKKSKAIKSLKVASRQIKRALGFINSSDSIRMIVGGEEVEVVLGNRNLRTLLLVKELFSDEYSKYSRIIHSLTKKTNVPCIALDYGELNLHTGRLRDEESFFKAYDLAYTHGVKHMIFSRLRISGTGLRL